MADKHIEDFIIPSYLVDGDKLLSPSSVLSILQELSYRGSDELGCGVDFMLSKGLAWVLSRDQFVIHRYPRISEKVRLETWYRGFDGLMVLRDYRILSPDGEPLVSATSSSLIIDINTRELKRTDHLPDVISPEPQNPEPAIGHNADRIVLRGLDIKDCGIRRTVRYTDTDFVGHLNNTCYLKWAMDCDRELGESTRPKEVCINFVKETKLGEVLSFGSARTGDGILYTASTGVNPHMAVLLK
ncbi:MAG: hypothetical protein IJS07_03705 [Bacteroidales bacterium]|nr:hypothetical protein [Bacteroidales bacterium]